MKHVSAPSPAVVVHVSGSYGQSWANDLRQQNETLFTASGVLDPYRARQEQPERWARYINETYPDDAMAMQIFGVSQRTVQYWREGDRAGSQHHQRIALKRDGQKAWETLIA